jgi:hypothetical protein
VGAGLGGGASAAAGGSAAGDLPVAAKLGQRSGGHLGLAAVPLPGDDAAAICHQLASRCRDGRGKDPCIDQGEGLGGEVVHGLESAVERQAGRAPPRLLISILASLEPLGTDPHLMSQNRNICSLRGKVCNFNRAP